MGKGSYSELVATNIVCQSEFPGGVCVCMCGERQRWLRQSLTLAVRSWPWAGLGWTVTLDTDTSGGGQRPGEGTEGGPKPVGQGGQQMAGQGARKGGQSWRGHGVISTSQGQGRPQPRSEQAMG